MNHWKPTASLEALRYRAEILDQIRAFFRERRVLEVETPLMASAGVTDPHIASITANFKLLGATASQTKYLQTSPEYAMKRLLAAGSGPIFQICKAFRDGEVGRLHNPEFTMLEWYRTGFDAAALMEEVEALIRVVLPKHVARYYTYQSLFETFLHFDPFAASVFELQQVLKHYNISQLEDFDRDTLLQMAMAHAIEPHLPPDELTFVTEFPASQAALARLKKDDPRVAERFEVYAGGMELANGFYELTDAEEQRFRFEQDLRKRAALSYPAVPLDERLLGALTHGLPDCSGVALGVDRLMMLGLEAKHIGEVMSFDFAHI